MSNIDEWLSHLLLDTPDVCTKNAGMSLSQRQTVFVDEAYDPFSPDVIANPYPSYARLLRAGGPVFLPSRDLWVLSRYRDVSEAARAHSRLLSSEGVAYQRMALPMMLTMDPPDHTRLRMIVARDFTPRAVASWSPTIERLTRATLEPLIGAGPVDFVRTVSGPLPVMAIASVLGIPREDHEQFRVWSDGVVEGFSPGSASDESIASRVTKPLWELQTYFARLIEERRAHPKDDLVTKLLQPNEDGRLSERELLWFLLLLLVAGNETTTSLLGNMALAFATCPDQWALLRAQPELVSAAVEEVLRFDAPIQGFFRTAAPSCQVGSVPLPAGARVLLLFGAANRDPDQYAEPDVFRIERNPTDHLAFGAGIHRCLGSSLARLEATLLLRLLVERTTELRLTGTPVRTVNPSLRGLQRLPIQLVPA